jgi:hypothetical protein
MEIAKPEILRCLAISTAHISKRDDELLDEDASWYVSPKDPPYRPFLLVAVKNAGYFVYVNSDPEILGEDMNGLLKRGYSQAFMDILAWACDNKIDWLELDADGPEYDGLPTFDW